MSGHPRIAKLDAAEKSLPPVVEMTGRNVEVVRASTLDQAVQLLRDRSSDGGPNKNNPPGDFPVPTSSEILERLSDGLAVIRPDFTLLWSNRAFETLCGEPCVPGIGIYKALRCEEIEGPDFCPFTNCITEDREATTVIRVTSGAHLQLRVQPIGKGGVSSSALMLCCVRDITDEIREREKLLAIHRAGLELSHLTQLEISQMSVTERLDLLKANILQYSQNILQFKNFEIRTLEKKTNALRVLISEGMIADARTRDLVALADGNGVTGFVAATGSSYLCHDVQHDPLYIPGASDARSSMTVPIIYREEVVGTFNVESPKLGNFSDRDQEFLEIFAREIAVALNTLELLQAEKRFSGKATVEAIVEEVSLPADDIISDALRVLGNLEGKSESEKAQTDAIRNILRNARAIKSSIHQIRCEYETHTSGNDPEHPSWLVGRRVLLADNDPAIRRSAHWMLGRAACEVDTAKDGQEALTMARTMKYDVVLGDIRLPDMNGYEFFCHMRDKLGTTPVILMTGFGYDSAHSLVKARQDGLKVVLYKPFRFDRLCEAIEDAVDPQRSQLRPHAFSRHKQSVL